jgi:hypothetical protein
MEYEVDYDVAYCFSTKHDRYGKEYILVNGHKNPVLGLIDGDVYKFENTTPQYPIQIVVPIEYAPGARRHMKTIKIILEDEPVVYKVKCMRRDGWYEGMEGAGNWILKTPDHGWYTDRIDGYRRLTSTGRYIAPPPVIVEWRVITVAVGGMREMLKAGGYGGASDPFFRWCLDQIAVFGHSPSFSVENILSKIIRPSIASLLSFTVSGVYPLLEQYWAIRKSQPADAKKFALMCTSMFTTSPVINSPIGNLANLFALPLFHQMTLIPRDRNSLINMRINFDKIVKYAAGIIRNT